MAHDDGDRTLPGGTVVCALTGTEQTAYGPIHEIYDALARYIDEHGLRHVGPARVLYVAATTSWTRSRWSGPSTIRRIRRPAKNPYLAHTWHVPGTGASVPCVHGPRDPTAGRRRCQPCLLSRQPGRHHLPPRLRLPPVPHLLRRRAREAWL